MLITGNMPLLVRRSCVERMRPSSCATTQGRLSSEQRKHTCLVGSSPDCSCSSALSIAISCLLLCSALLLLKWNTGQIGLPQLLLAVYGKSRYSSRVKAPDRHSCVCSTQNFRYVTLV